ncbi:hypothetical protein LSH36_1652g00062 [Paralvinella palmiformis]|uniref:Cytochrome P450 n=1 Tax=Paralvinella palmiformis TaxID=53620 RepID=A0AAD9ISD4_9ANNE|nr:hypothetical protein LSH36_1652g00062 [Paralvinella palmiformis]
MIGLEMDLSISNPQVWLIGIIVFFLTYNYLTKESWKRLPPGPPALPLIGSLPFLGSSDIRVALRKLAIKYGDIFTIYLGRRRVVVLNKYEVIHDAFVKNAQVFSGRPNIFTLTIITGGYGIFSSEGEFWREQRRYALHILREFGVGHSKLEERILEEITFFIQEIEKNTDKHFNPQPVIQKSVANVIASVTFGKRMDYEDPIFIKYMKIFNRCLHVIGSSGVINTFPFIRFLPGDLFHIKQVLRDFDYMCSEYQRIIDEHKKAAKEGKQDDDFISVYLKKIEEEKNVEDSSFTEKQLVAICNNLFVAGTETSTNTLAWAILYMSLNPDTQARVHAEIDDVLGNDALPSMHHRIQLPFTEATILETQRLGDVVPLGVPHAVTEDVYFRDYFIPKGTMVIPNMYSVHMNPELWPEPEKFKPQRFLDSDGNIDQKELIPFSVGKRQCLGEGLAKMELFLYFTSMMQHFNFKPAPGYPAPNTKGVLGITNAPKPFHVLVGKRHSK